MSIDPAITEALDSTLAEIDDQTEDFKRRFRRMIGLVLSGNYEDSDVRNVLESIHVVVQVED